MLLAIDQEQGEGFGGRAWVGSWIRPPVPHLGQEPGDALLHVPDPGQLVL
jgi:hypothetical protein